MAQIQTLPQPYPQPTLATLVTTLATTLVTTLVLTAMPAPSRAEAIVDGLAATPTAQKTLTMGTAADYPPFQFKLENSDQIQGFEIDLANAIAAKLGLAITLTDMNFEALIPALQANQIDLAMTGMTPTPERERLVNFSQPYFNARPAIVTPRGNRLAEPGDFAGKTIGVQTGTIHEAQMVTLAQTIADMQVSAFATVTAMMGALQAGEIDAAILEETVANLYAAGNTALRVTPMLGEAQEPIAIAFPLGSAHVAGFNRVLQEMAANGALDRLIKKWFEQQ